MRSTVGACVTLAIVGFCVQGCTFHRSIAIRYTPMIQAERLADANNPETIVVGVFEDARVDKAISKERLNPISVHKLQFDLSGDLEGTIRGAFVDGLLKSGFVVPMSAPGTGKPLTINGRILTYSTDTKTGWSKATVTGTVEVELTIDDGTNPAKVLTATGENQIEGSSIGFEAWPDILDKALRACVDDLLASNEFRALVKR
jgi:hypothetical protein